MGDIGVSKQAVIDLLGPNFQFNDYADYFVFIDAADSNIIKARNNATSIIDYQHATDAGDVMNSVIAALSSGGLIAVGPGTFNVTTTIVPTSLIRIIGSGDATVFKLANSVNVDVFKSSNFATLTGTNGTGGVHSCEFQDF